MIQGVYDFTLLIDDCERAYRLHVPADFVPPRPLPLVIMMHGGAMSVTQMERITGLSELARRNQFLLAYPVAVGRFKERQRCWNDCRIPEVDDVAFITALIDELLAGGTVDSRRIYLAGYSNGACMVHRLAVELAGRIAAIACVSGTIDVGMAACWQPGRALPVLTFHGTGDPFAYYEGGTAGTSPGASLAADQCALWWVRKNGCPSQVPDETEFPDSSGLFIKRYAYDEGKETEVIFYCIEGGGHTWPGKPGVLPEKIYGKTALDLDASEIIWRFFARHRLPE